ncbi:unnamed protein product, partial [Allacma fusca]
MAGTSTDRLLSQPFKISASTEATLVPSGDEHSKRFKEFDNMRERGEQCDVVFVTTGNVKVKKRIYAHKLIVYNASPYCASVISSMDANTQVEIPIEGIEHGVLEQIISYMYTGTLAITLSKVEAIYAGSHILQLGSVKEECVQLLTTNALARPATTFCRKPEKLDASSVFGELWFSVFNRVFEAFVILVESDEFVKIPENHFKTLIELFLTHKSDFDHKMLCYAMNTWVNYCRQGRAHMIEWILKILEKESKHPAHIIEEISFTLTMESEVASGMRNEIEVDDGYSDTSSSVQEVCNVAAIRRKRTCGPSSVTSPKLPKLSVGIAKTDALMGFIEGEAATTRSLWTFDFQEQKFTPLVPMPTVANVQTSQEEIVYVADKIFVIGGLNQSSGLTSDLVFVNRFSQSKTWSQCAKLNISRKEFAAVVHNDFIYVIGGTNTKNSRGGLSSVERFNYNEKRSKWMFVANMSEPRVTCCASVLREKIFVVGGKQNKGSKKVLGDVEIYDIENNMWTAITDMWIPRCEFGLALCNDQLYAIGGQNDTGVLESVEVYDPITNKWSFTESLGTGRKFP